jgi:predicted secreted protein
LNQTGFTSELVLAIGEERTVALTSLAMAGYQWSGSVGGPDPGTVALELRPGELPPGSRAGLSAPEEAVLRGIHPGHAIVRLEQRRPWERDRPAAQVVELEVVVRA